MTLDQVGSLSRKRLLITLLFCDFFHSVCLLNWNYLPPSTINARMCDQCILRVIARIHVVSVYNAFIVSEAQWVKRSQYKFWIPLNPEQGCGWLVYKIIESSRILCEYSIQLANKALAWDSTRVWYLCIVRLYFLKFSTRCDSDSRKCLLTKILKSSLPHVWS